MISLWSWLEQPLAEAVGWALVHFLWQGTAVAAALAGVLARMRGRTAQVRYLTACAGLATMSLLPIATTVWCGLQQSSVARAAMDDRVAPGPEESPLRSETGLFADTEAARAAPLTMAPPIEVAPGNGASLTTSLPSATVSWRARMRSIVPWLVCGWLTGVILLSLRLLMTWARVQQLKRVGTTAPAGEVTALHVRLLAQLHVARPVQLVLSTLVEVPTVIGWLSPVILLPAGALLGLAPAQLEALLAHELAHIRRWDYLVNLFQNLVETLLFYHPAVWWLSARVRQERENCCDDLAARVCGDPVSYAEALLRMEELRVPAGNLALAARGGHLLCRVRRLLGNAERDGLFPLWQSGAIAFLIVAGMSAALWSMTDASVDRGQAHASDASGATIFDSPISPTDSEAPVEDEPERETALAFQPAEPSGNKAAPPRQDDVRPGELSAKQVLDSIDRAKRLLLKSQQADGSWTSRPNNNFAVGVSSLALLALLNTGMTVADPEIERGLAWLRQQQPMLTYEISLMIQALAAARDGNRDGVLVANLVRDLEETQLRQGPNAGSWTYSRNTRGFGGGDRSNGQFAVLGLREAQEMGVPVSRETWERARDHWLVCQNDDGGWGYSGPKTANTSTGSMTVAGIATLVMTQTALRAREADLDANGLPTRGEDPQWDQPLEDAGRWLGNNFSVTQNPRDSTRWLLYYLYGLERAGRFSGRRFFVDGRGQKHDWYREGADYLVSQQNPATGAWQGLSGENDAVVGTSFALMFLSKGLAPVLINKLQYGPRDPTGGGIAGADWNRHHDDVRNLTQLISKLPNWPKLLTWQTVDISQATAAELLQAPILFLSGSDAPHFTQQDVALLKEYVEQGGVLFADNCGRRLDFDEGFHELVRQLYPPSETQLKKLTADHPVFHSEFNLLDERTGESTAELWGVTIGGRTSIIYSPKNVSGFWDRWTPFGVPGRPQELAAKIDNATRVGVNVATYVTARKLLNKLDRRR